MKRKTKETSLQLKLDFNSRFELNKGAFDTNDNDRLLALQYKVLMSSDKDATAQLWLFGAEVCKRIIKNKAKRKGIVYSTGDLQDLSITAVEYVLKRYTKKKIIYHDKVLGKTTYQERFGWRYFVKDNFIKVFSDAVTHAMFHRTKSEKNIIYMSDCDIAALIDKGAKKI